MRTFHNPDEALDYVLSIVDDFKNRGGIKVQIKPYDLESDHGKKMANECRGLEGHASPTKWCRIVFCPKDEHESKAIFEAQKLLGNLGIYFDSGGGCGQRDWETDWSFCYTPKEFDSQDYQTSISSVERLLKDI